MTKPMTPDDVFDLAASIARKVVGPNQHVTTSIPGEPDVPDDVCDACVGQGSHIQSGMVCPHCNGTGAR